MRDADLNAGCVVKVAHPGRRANKRQRIWRVRDWSIHKSLRPRCFQDRHVACCRLKNGHHTFDIIGKELVIKILWHAVRPCRAPFMRVRAQQECVSLAAQIKAQVWIADQREQGRIRLKLRQGRRHHVLMLERDHGQL